MTSDTGSTRFRGFLGNNSLGDYVVQTWNEKFDKYVNHFTKYQDPASVDKVQENGIKVIDSDIGRKVGFSRVAVHHMVLPSGCRTSSPHAESLEEEFVFVLKGNPHLWINGYIYDLKEGHAVGFPAGTGIAHTFINNTDEDIHLLVAGEKTKPENLCSFPINPELKESCGIWWGEAPVHSLGSHNGLPGLVKQSERGTDSPECLIYCPDVEKGKVFHYPGDNEAFGTGFRITDKVGLKALGIWYECLPPGRRSAFPHAHTHEEEFVYVLKGRPTIWMDGFAKQVEEGYFAAFSSNTGISHTVINDTDEDVIYICIGEAEDFKQEKITYPLNPLRNKECARKGWLWEDVPQLDIGSHRGKPNRPFGGHLSFRVCSEENVNEVLDIFKKSPNYFIKVDGCLPTEKTAKHSLVDGPKKTNEKYFKEFLVIEHEERPIGILDLHANHPEEGVCYLGLLLLEENQFGKGLGRKSYELAEDYIKRALECKKIRLGVSDENDVSDFWMKMGFESNGKTYEWKGEEKTANVREFDKVLGVN